MKISEVKAILTKWSEEIIDVWFSNGRLTDSLLKPTIKVVSRNYLDKADDFLKMFSDKDGNVMIESLLDQYVKDAIPENGLVVDPTKLLGDNILTRQIGSKLLERSDIHKLKEMLKYGSQVDN